MSVLALAAALQFSPYITPFVKVIHGSLTLWLIPLSLLSSSLLVSLSLFIGPLSAHLLEKVY